MSRGIYVLFVYLLAIVVGEAILQLGVRLLGMPAWAAFLASLPVCFAVGWGIEAARQRRDRVRR